MNKLTVSPSPHIHGKLSTSRLMGDVLIALVPAFAVSVWVFGVSALLVTAVAVASCVLFEAVIQKWLLGQKENLPRGLGNVCDQIGIDELCVLCAVEVNHVHH